MKKLAVDVVLVIAVLFPLGALRVTGQTAPSIAGAVHHATGTFDVKLTPQPSDPPLGRMSLEKQFHGGLEGTSKGEMLATGSGEKGSSGGYVALEQFTGTLDGRKGTFILQHSGTLDRGAQRLTITVVPGSGTGELAGLTGQLAITIANGKHSYDFEYTLPQKP
jgi:hypothetical protein